MKTITNPLLPGTMIGDWRIIKFVHASETSHSHSYYECECKCGEISQQKHAVLVKGKSTKCRSCAANSRVNPPNPTGIGISGSGKLTCQDHEEIIASIEKYSVLAERYNVSPQAISLIKIRNGARRNKKRNG
jgi:hypothetical protein